MTAAWALAIPALVTAGLVVVNALSWRRPRPGGTLSGTLSVLVPARNEEGNIEACIESVVAATGPDVELLVYDDASTDRTSEILATLVRRHPRVRVIPGGSLPRGWVGKPHACHRLASVARGELLLFLDADVRLSPDGIGRLASVVADRGLDGRLPALVTAVPRQDTGSFTESLLLPLLHLTYTAWLPLPLVRYARSPRVLAANGQLLLVRRALYDEIGGFAAVRSAVVDDMAFCRLAKDWGACVAFVDGHDMATCRMYRSGKEVVAGFSKNLFEGLGSTAGLLVATSLVCAAFVLPYLALFAVVLGVAPAAWSASALVGVAANVLARWVLAIRHGHSALSVVLHPVAVLVMVAVAFRSRAWSRRGAIAWRGRSYARRADRESA